MNLGAGLRLFESSNRLLCADSVEELQIAFSPNSREGALPTTIQKTPGRAQRERACPPRTEQEQRFNHYPESACERLCYIVTNFFDMHLIRHDLWYS